MLRPWATADLDALVAICDDPDVARFTPLPTPYTHADGRAWLGGALARMQAGQELSLAIHEAGHGPVGTIGVRVDDGDRDVAELGYVVARPARGRGIATRSVRLVGGVGAARVAPRAPAADDEPRQRSLADRRRAGRVRP